MSKKENCIETLFALGDKIENDYFIGNTWLRMLVEDDDFHCPIGNVTFEAGARNNWHIHPGGQILLVTQGVGYYQEEGKAPQVLNVGDVVKISPNVKHWHGASKDHCFSHLAITTNPQLGGAQWMEPVNDEYYNQL